jgi:hypothetical protein
VTAELRARGLWLTEAATLKHFSWFYVFLGYRVRWHVWACIIRHAEQLLPAVAPIVAEFDDTIQKKTGRHIEGVSCVRNRAGSAATHIGSYRA